MSISVEVDLRSHFGPVRDQGARPTCLAFAASDAHAALRGNWQALSCEYAFYHAQKRTGRSPLKGAFLSEMLATLRDEGQPVEGGWPYLHQLPSDMSAYRPPASVGDCYGRDSRQSQHDVDRICVALDNGSPLIVLSVLTRSFFRPAPNGLIDQVANEEVFPTPRHAIVAVGYGTVSGGRVVLIRNSWGPSWGLNGYGWLTEQFLQKHMYDLALLTDICDVSRRSAAA